MLRHENVAEVGDVIKCMDFEPRENRPDHYLVGRVLEKTDVGYKVYVINSETGDDDLDVYRIGTEMFVPFELSIMEYDERIVKLEEAR